jgi:hypothetical protein
LSFSFGCVPALVLVLVLVSAGKCGQQQALVLVNGLFYRAQAFSRAQAGPKM